MKASAVAKPDKARPGWPTTATTISAATWHSNYSTAAAAAPVPADGGCDGPARAIAATCSGDDERHA